MSLETHIQELNATMASLIPLLQTQIANQERLLAGQAKAIDVVATGNPSTAGKRTRKTKDAEPEATDTPNTSDEPADTASGAEDAKTASEEAPVAEEPKPAATKTPMKFSEAAKKWLDKEPQGSDGYKARGKTIMGILANFGAAKMSELEEADEAKAMFFLKRAASGLTINFDAAYDFAGDPKQDEPAAEAAEADDDSMFD